MGMISRGGGGDRHDHEGLGGGDGHDQQRGGVIGMITRDWGG